MRAVGIIAEYNPFHAGHALQLARARALTGADAVVVALAGAFTQRGEPALIDKWARARMALGCGADIVVELPCLFALREARGFAEGGVRLLSALGIVDALSFGCEPEGMALIGEVARCLAEEPAPYRAQLRAALDRGLSYPRARAEAAAAQLGIAPAALNRPNFALALEYAQANARLKRPLELLPIARGSDYHGLALGEVCSASAIRAAIERGETDAALEGVPAQCRAELAAELPRRARPRLVDELALIRLRGMTPAELGAYPGLGEGLEALICRQARRCASTAELIAACKSKRYTYARLRRLTTQVALGITRDLQAAHPAPEYVRVLACRRGALGLLGEIKRRGALPLASDVARMSEADAMWALETRATDLWGLCTECAEYRRAGRDYTQRFIVVD